MAKDSFEGFFMSREMRKARLYEILKKFEHRNSDVEAHIRRRLIEDLKHVDGIDSAEKAVFQFQYRMNQVHVPLLLEE